MGDDTALNWRAASKLGAALSIKDGIMLPEEEFNAHCDTLWEMYYQIRDTPAISVEGIAGKVRVAWIQEHNTIEAELAGPPDNFVLVGELAPQRFVWSALRDPWRRPPSFPA